MPCLNEEKTVAECVTDALAWVKAAGLTGEVIVVDNGSTDRSVELASAAGARVITESQRGKGHAMRRGLSEAAGEYVVMSDSDGTYDLRKLGPVVEPLKNGYDLVIGNRLRGRMQRGSMPWLHKRVGNPIFSAVISIITRRRFGDVLSGLRSFKRESWSVMALQSTGFELESEMCLRAARRGLRVLEVPINYGKRREPSKLRGLAHGWAIARFIVLESADVIFFIPSVIAVLLGTVSLILGVVDTSGVDVGSFRWQPVFAGGILIPGGIALMTIGLVAKWIAWTRGIIEEDMVVRLLNARSLGFLELLLAVGAIALVSGVLLDVYLLTRWTLDDPDPHALGLGAVAQTLVVSGLNTVVMAVIIGVLNTRSASAYGSLSRVDSTHDG
jgi:hypothetical protein